MLPNFLILGAPRAGTTWLYQCLKEHPQIFMPEQKELNFFSKEFDKGLSFYESFFETAKNFNVIGEASPSYLGHEQSPERIAKYIPKGKLIVILRDPIDRAFSHYTIFKRFHNEKNFEEAIEKRPGLLTRGLYYSLLMNYLKYFDRKSILILLYEDINKNEIAFIKKVYSFLNVDKTFIPTKIKQPTNLTIFPLAQKYLYKFHLDFVIDLVKKTSLNNILRNAVLKNKVTKPPKYNLLTLNKLKEYYRDPNKELEIFLNRKLSDWK